MIKEIKYRIKFPFGAVFKEEPEIILLKKIYKEIRDCVCLTDKQCDLCKKKELCVYYMISGENFKQYPSIGIKRNTINRKRYSSKDVLEVVFYLIGVAANYYEFVTSYLETTEYIGNVYFQKICDSIKTLKDDDTYDGTLKFNNVIIDEEDIIESIKYYNTKYKCNFLIPEILNLSNYMDFNDYNIHRFNDQKIIIKGKLSKCSVKNYPMSLISAGVGKYAFLGGGAGKCE